jgi:hypothetical protein
MAPTDEMATEIRQLNAEILVISAFASAAFLASTADVARHMTLNWVHDGLVPSDSGSDSPFDGTRRRTPDIVHDGLVISDNGRDPPYGRRLTRTSHLLDSLSQVCVSKSEVFAIGLAVRGHQPCRYQLVIAENKGVDKDARAYISELMTRLSDLSAAVASGSDAHSRALTPTLQEIRAMPESVQGNSLLILACFF